MKTSIDGSSASPLITGGIPYQTIDVLLLNSITIFSSHIKITVTQAEMTRYLCF